MNKKSKKTEEIYDIVIPVEFITRIKVTNNFPNKRSIVQHRAVDELRKLLGDDLFLGDRIKRGRAHSKQVKS